MECEALENSFCSSNGSEFEAVVSSEETESRTIIEKNDSPHSIIEKVSSLLADIIQKNKGIKNYDEYLTKLKSSTFNSAVIPKISISEYLERIIAYCTLDDSEETIENTLISAIIYIDRINKLNGIILTEYNIHRILFCSILAYIKYNLDEFYQNNYYSKVAGVSPAELFYMESEFFKSNDFNLYISDEIFNKYKSKIVANEEQSPEEMIIF